MHILHTVLYTFSMVRVRRICLKIKHFFSLWSSALFSWPKFLIQGWSCKKKLDVRHAWFEGLRALQKTQKLLWHQPGICAVRCKYGIRHIFDVNNRVFPREDQINQRQNNKAVAEKTSDGGTHKIPQHFECLPNITHAGQLSSYQTTYSNRREPGEKKVTISVEIKQLKRGGVRFSCLFWSKSIKNFQPPRIPLITFLSEILMMLIILLVYCCCFMIFKFSCSNKKYNFLASQFPLEFDKLIYLIQSEEETSYLNFKRCQAKLSSIFCTPRNLNSLMPCLSLPW